MNNKSSLGQSQKAADHAIERILELRNEVANLKHEVRNLKHEQTATPSEDELRHSILLDEIEATATQIEVTQKRLTSAEKALGVRSCQRLEKLKGNGFLRLRMNVRALKARMRARLVNHKFECRKLERVYRHQVMHTCELF